jgi:hypothetical protein
MLGGYDRKKFTAAVARIYVHKNDMDKPDQDFGVYFGAQMREIQRLVHGTDPENKAKLIRRVSDLLDRYHTLLSQQLQDAGIQFNLKAPNQFGDRLWLFHDWDLEHLNANIGAFSEQNAIDCVDFLVNIMIKSQQFSAEMPTVGGEVQMAVVKKGSGFTYVSKREWRHGDHAVPIQE